VTGTMAITSMLALYVVARFAVEARNLVPSILATGALSFVLIDLYVLQPRT
jgi:uncharacterized MnhB-related membrane protein